MTIAIFALDGLDFEYCQERGLLHEVEPSLLENDLEGANGLYTYRIWPSIFAGVNGGKAGEPYASYSPDAPYLWEQYDASVMLAPIGHPPYSQYQDGFPEGYRESVGPQERTDEAFQNYRDGIDAALEREAEVLVVGSKLPDILGHNDQNADRIESNIETLCEIVTETVAREEVTEYLVLSDHGFEYESFGEKPSGLAAHTPRACVCSSFVDYDSMATLIEEWHSDLSEALKEQRLSDLGYI